MVDFSKLFHLRYRPPEKKPSGNPLSPQTRKRGLVDFSKLLQIRSRDTGHSPDS